MWYNIIKGGDVLNYGFDMLARVLENEAKVPDPSVTPDTSVLDLQAVVARLDRLEQMISQMRQTSSDNENIGDDNSDNKEGEDNTNEG